MEEIVKRVRSLLQGNYREDDIMIVAPDTQHLAISQALMAAGVAVAMSETEQGGVVCLTDFVSVKGLEKEVVFVTGIESLPHRDSQELLFASEESKRRARTLRAAKDVR